MKHLNDFRKQHNIDRKANLSCISVAVECIFEVSQAVRNYLASIEQVSDRDLFIASVHMSLLGRIQQHAEGMLSCIACNCPASAEALGRIVIEGSINLTYLSSRGDEATIIAFFRSWLLEHSRKLKEWKEKIQGQPHEIEVGKSIDGRIEAVGAYEWYIGVLSENFSLNNEDLSKHWPNSLYKRFEALGLEESYYTAYHRLSAESHITPENTMYRLLALQRSEEDIIAMSRETYSYSLMMTRICCGFFVDAALACCTLHGMNSEELTRFHYFKDKLQEAASELAEAAGCV